jgi:hypothetical protein
LLTVIFLGRLNVEKTLKFVADKEVKHSVRYKEVVEEGMTPVIGTLYVQRWFAKDSEELEIKIKRND